MRVMAGLASIVGCAMALIVAPPAAAAVRPADARVISATGLAEIDGATALVEVVVHVPEGRKPGAVAREALAAFGARPLPATFGHDESFPPLRWRQFHDRSRGNDFVRQYYNPAGEPAEGGDYRAALLAGQGTWSDVSTASFAFEDGGTTSRCPSSICTGTRDGYNDLGWYPLEHECSSCLGLAIVWFRVDTGFIVEADVALTTDARWFADEDAAGEHAFDAHFVMLHENGHVAGLEHVWDPEAVMFPFASPGLLRRDLAQSDVDALSLLYPLGSRSLSPETPVQPPKPGAPGELDPGFHGDGRVTAGLGSAAAGEARDVARQPDGKIVAAGLSFTGGDDGDFVLVRYLPDGSIDPDFGAAGRVSTDFGGGFDTANAVTVQPDGRIVAAGLAAVADGFGFALARYNADGSLDSSFGSGGKVTAALGGGAGGVAVQPDGRIVAAGTRLAADDPWSFAVDFALVRYNVDGSLDGGFGSGGMVTTDFDGAFDTASAVAIAADGRIIVAGTTDIDFAVARYAADGSPDASFGSGGRTVTDFAGDLDVATDVAVRPNGGPIAVGFAFTPEGGGDFALAGYAPDGSADPAFGAGGKVLTDFPDGFFDVATALDIQSDGKVVAAGARAGFGEGLFDFALARYHPNGALDQAFGTGGRVTTDVGDEFDAANGLALGDDGRIVAAGVSGSALALARYSADGSLDAGFGYGGTVITSFRHPTRARAVAVQADGRIVGAGTASSDFVLVRLTPEGFPDASFGFGGTVSTDFGAADEAMAMALQGDGRVVVAGASGGDVALARYDADGSLDEDFGTGGMIVIDLGAATDEARAVALQPDGRIVVAGVSGGDFALARLNVDGSLDPSFAGDGTLVADIAGDDAANAVTVQRDGHIVAAGVSGGDVALARYDARGLPDPGFGTGGSVVSDLGATETVHAMVLGSADRILVAGASGGDVLLARYTPDGSLDSGFAQGGKVTTDFGGDDQGRALVVHDGRLLVAGSAATPDRGRDFALVRYRPDGSLDDRFGAGGRVSTDFGCGQDDEALALAVHSDGRAVAAGRARVCDLDDIALARYLG